MGEWTHCNSLQLTATHCNTLQLTATHCNTLQRISTWRVAGSWITYMHISGGKLGRLTSSHMNAHTRMPIHVNAISVDVHYMHISGGKWGRFTCSRTMLIGLPYKCTCYKCRFHWIAYMHFSGGKLGRLTSCNISAHSVVLRPIECLYKSLISYDQSPIISGSFAERDLQIKASYFHAQQRLIKCLHASVKVFFLKKAR